MFDMVAPLVVVPTQSGGISNISFSQRAAACSVSTEAGFAVQIDPCWSSAEISQSPGRCARCDPAEDPAEKAGAGR